MVSNCPSTESRLGALIMRFSLPLENRTPTLKETSDELEKDRVLSAGGSLFTGLCGASRRQEFPRGPVKIIIPFPPGGPTDTVGRLIAQKLQEVWAHQVLIDYKPGAGTAIGVDFVAKAAPDGARSAWSTGRWP